MSKTQLKKEISNIMRQHLGKSAKLFIYGSQANQKEFSRSDIDLGIEDNTSIELSKMSQLREDLEKLRTLRKFDLTDFANVEESFKRVALSNVEYF